MDTTATLERPAEPAGTEEEEDLAVHRYVLKNRFVLKDLDAGSRTLVYGAIGALLITAAAIATRDLPWPDFEVGGRQLVLCDLAGARAARGVYQLR